MINGEISDILLYWYRAISYLFHWHKQGFVYDTISHEDFTAPVVHQVMTKYLRELKECLEEQNELVCFYQEEGNDGNLKVRESFKMCISSYAHSQKILTVETASILMNL